MSIYRSGNSKSGRALTAESDGRATWSTLPKAARHGLTKAEAVTLELHLGEWHHTSSYANRAEYFSPEVIADILNGITTEQAKAVVAARVAGYSTGTVTDETRRLDSLISDRATAAWDREDWTR